MKRINIMTARISRSTWMLLSAAILVSGCSSMTGGGEVVISSDSASAAYVCARQWFLPLPPECPIFRSTVWVRWCDLSRPGDYRSAKIGVFGKDWGGWYVQNRVHPVFSPGNRYLAVACPRSLRVIDCAGTEQRILTGPEEVVTSLVWVGADELAYAACKRGEGKSRGKWITHFWRQRTRQSHYDRELIFSQEDTYGCPEKGLSAIEWPRQRWSPDGSFVLIRSYAPPWELRLIDVAAGTSRIPAPAGYNFEGISWKTDGSEAACVGFKRDRPMVAFLINPRTGRTHDFSAEFNGAFGEDSSYSAPPIGPLWTPDDQYLVVDHAKIGGCLVRPRPWKITPVAKHVVDHLVREGSHVLAEDSGERLPWVFRQPAKGWLKVWVQFQEKGYRQGMDYLVDYSGESVTALAESSAPGGGWKLTPDGIRAVKLESSGALVVRKVALPATDPTRLR